MNQLSYTDFRLDCRQALRYIIRNTTLPARTRAEAQLQLTQMHCYTRPTQIRNRCIMGGKGRGVLRDFKMTRVGPLVSELGSRCCGLLTWVNSTISAWRL
jgi:small subunit ribosomal protein S14